MTKDITIYNQNKKIIPRIKDYTTNIIDRSKNELLEPIIITNFIKKWSATDLWTPIFFKSEYGKVEVETNHDLPSDLSPYLHDEQPYHTKMMCLADFINIIPNSKSCYVAQSDVSILEGIDKHYNFYDIIPKSEHDSKISTNIWLGFNTRSGLHFDYNDNFLAQIYGTKKVFLAPPVDTEYLYPLPENFSKTQVNPMNPDFKRFPKLKYASIYEGEIKAGDVLFIPRGWYHYIYSPDVSISLNCWYGTPLKLVSMAMFLFRSGIKTWVRFVYDFIWQGVLGKPFKGRLYCSDTMGKRAHKFIMNKMRSG